MSPATGCGIDFGTSNSTVALAAAGRAPALVGLEDGKTAMPSAVFYRNNVTPVFGRAGIAAYLAGEEGRLIRGLKKILGTSLMEERTLFGNRPVYFTAILETFLGHLKSRADEAAGVDVENVVMGRPVHFHDNDHDADQLSQNTLEKIARATGFKNVEFLFEPIAAAFAHEAKVEGEKIALVIDLGGGTSDFTVIRIARDRIGRPDRTDDILATAGVRVGGTNFDYRLSLKGFMPHLGLGTAYADIFDADKMLDMPLGPYAQLSDWPMVHHAQTAQAVSQTRDLLRRAAEPDKVARLLRVQENHLGHALLEEVEGTKIALTAVEKHMASLGELEPDLRFPVTRKKLEGAIRADVRRVMDALAGCVADAGLRPEQIGLLIMTGGSTELPVINQLVTAMFPHAEVSQGNRLDSVGLGLAYQANKIF
jgi:hypothetical chaperone protein